MICVTLGRTGHTAFLKGHRELAEQGAELVELRVDWIRKRPNIGRLLKDRPTPVVVTCRREADHGRWEGTEEQRQALLREAVIDGAEYVDIEEDIAKSIPRYGSTRRIISYHNFEETPVDLRDIYDRMTNCDPDIIKIVTMARQPSDNVRMLEMLRSVDRPTVGFCMGDFGTISRILCGRMGAPLTYAGFSSQREMAPGQLTFAETRDLYRFREITDQTKIFGVIGDPIAHSLSPLLHNTAFRDVGFDGVYLPLRIPADGLQESLKEFEKLDISGYSVTIPHKENALKFAEVRDMQSDLIGAANTLFRRDGKWHATNTDYDAIIETIVEALEVSPTHTPDLAGSQVLILGAGGVARAAACAMLQKGASVTVTNRTQDRADALARELSCRTSNWADRGAESCEILINCTSAGMHPNVTESPYDQLWLNESMLVFDTVYTPENTQLLQDARVRGCATASGLEMFVRQAARQFKLFTGHEPPTFDMKETLRQSLSSIRT